MFREYRGCHNVYTFMFREYRGCHSLYSLKFFFCEVMNFVNVVGQLFFMDRYTEFQKYIYQINDFFLLGLDVKDKV